MPCSRSAWSKTILMGSMPLGIRSMGIGMGKMSERCQDRRDPDLLAGCRNKCGMTEREEPSKNPARRARFLVDNRCMMHWIIGISVRSPRCLIHIMFGVISST
jgi:hypothetical protein